VSRKAGEPGLFFCFLFFFYPLFLTPFLYTIIKLARVIPPVFLMAKQQPVITHVRDKDFREIYATGALGGFDSQGAFHITFYVPAVAPETLSSKPEEQKVEVKHMVKIVVTPTTLKQLSDWMAKNVEIFEKKFGEVKAPEAEESIIGAVPPETMYG